MNKTTTTKKHKKIVSKKPVSDKITETEPKMKVEISAEIKPESTSISYKTTTHNDKNKGLISKFFSSVVGEKKEIGMYDSVVQQVLDLDEKTKESFKDLSDELFKNPKDITEAFTRKISKYRNIEELLKELKSFIKSVEKYKK